MIKNRLFHQLTIRKTANLLREKQIKARELTEKYLKNIKDRNSKLNAYVTLTD